jgi:uncharacterized membrane protein YgcG
MKLTAGSLAAVVALIVLLQAPPVRAEIRDGAKFFSADAVRQGDQLIREIRQRHNKDVVIETVPSLPGVPAEAAARQEFYEQEVAKRGRAAGVNGVYVLASKEPRYLYAGVDPQTQRDAFTLEDRAKLRNVMIEHFKTNDFDRGLIAGLRMIDQTMASRTSRGRGATAVESSSPTPAQQTGAAPAGGASRSGAPSGGPVARGRGFGIGGWLCLGLAAIAIFAVVRGIMRRGAAARGFPVGRPQGYGQPGYGQPGYGPQGGGGGGFGRGMLGGLLGGVLGGAAYDHLRGGHGDAQASPPPADPGGGAAAPYDPGPIDTSGGGSFDSGSDFSGGGDFGGGGGDTSGGGDF